MHERNAKSFWERVEKVALTGCWVWRGRVASNRYGQFSFWEDGKTRTVYAHRFAHELVVGPIPVGYVLDHLCLNRTCVNPDHLDPVTQGENYRRGVGGRDGAAFQRNKTHCPHGHLYEGENLYIRKDGSRACRACQRAAKAKQHARIRAENPPAPRESKRLCANGHEFTPENTRVNLKGSRECRECRRAQARAYKARKGKQVVHRAAVCKNGHAMDEANSSYSAGGVRSCRACNREKARASRERRRGDGPVAPAARTSCPKGHLYDEANTYVTSQGHRQCRICNKAREIVRTEKRRAARAAR